MFVSKLLKEKNIAEYLIYMWQIEDLIRANGCDIEKIKTTIVNPYPLTEEQRAELTRWYMDLIEMMRREEVMEKGHLQINRNIIIWLTDLFARVVVKACQFLLAPGKFVAVGGQQFSVNLVLFSLFRIL